MAKVKFKNFGKVKGSIVKQLRLATLQTIRDTGIAENLADVVKNTVQKGIDPKTDKPYDDLKQSTIDRRRTLSKVNPTDEKYSPARSNLTFTGQLVRSIRAFARPAKGIIEIRPTGTHKQYKGIRKKRLGKPVRNSDISEGLQNKHQRNLIGISERVKKNMLKIIEKRLIKLIKRANK